MSRDQEIKRIVERTTNGFLGTLTDAVLFLIFYNLEFAFSFDRRGAPKAAAGARKTLEKINYKTIKRTVYHLKRKGFIKYLKRETFTKYQITDEGIKRLKEKIPAYDHKRIWDKRLYLITYDIPKKKDNKRNILREFLRRINCAYLQNSVWLTCYNPKNLIRALVQSNKIEGNILISDLGPDGSIGERDIKSLIEDVYYLEGINYDYEEFIKNFKRANKKNLLVKQKAAFTFLSILQNDPQLPFELLPDYWRGNDAYRLYKKIIAQ